MKIGYARVSTLDQQLDPPLRALKKAGGITIRREKVSGLSRQRPELPRLRAQLHPGGTVVVWKLARIARSARHLREIMDMIREAGARFRALSGPWAVVAAHAGKRSRAVFAGTAEFERDLIQERTTAGRLAAQERGGRFGRPRNLNAAREKLARRLVSEGQGVPEIAHTCNAHPSTIYRLSALDAEAGFLLHSSPLPSIASAPAGLLPPLIIGLSPS